MGMEEQPEKVKENSRGSVTDSKEGEYFKQDRVQWKKMLVGYSIFLQTYKIYKMGILLLIPIVVQHIK